MDYLYLTLPNELQWHYGMTGEEVLIRKRRIDVVSAQTSFHGHEYDYVEPLLCKDSRYVWECFDYWGNWALCVSTENHCWHYEKR